MSTGFKYKDEEGNWVDLEDALEPYNSNAPTVDLVNYFTNSNKLQGKFEGDADTPFVPYYYQGNQITAGPKGEMVSSLTDSCLFATKTSGTYSISRTETYIQIGDTTYTSDNFRSGSVPKKIGITFCGGGGGGSGATDADRDWGNGGGGAGGGVASLTIDLARLSGCTITLTVGGAGGHGGGGKSSASNGAAGGDSKLEVSGDYSFTCTAGGGSAGVVGGDVVNGGSVTYSPSTGYIKSGNHYLVKVTSATTGGKSGEPSDGNKGEDCTHNTLIGGNPGRTYKGTGGASYNTSPYWSRSSGGGGSLGNAGNGGTKSSGWHGYSASGYGAGGGGGCNNGTGSGGGNGYTGVAYFWY